MKATRNIGGSHFPSSAPHILLPIMFIGGFLQVRPMPEADTHALFFVSEQGEKVVASHPNGFSCHALAERMVSGDAARVREQAEYIVACGGSTQLLKNGGGL